MSRISRVLCAALCLCLCVCSAEEYLISPGDIVSNTSNYKTSVAVTGAYTKSAQGSVSQVFTHTTNVKYAGPAARYLEYYVKKGDTVEEGQPIAAFTVTPDTVALYQSELALTRAYEAYDEQKAAYEAALAEKTAKYEAETDEYLRENARLDMERARVSYEKYVYQTERDLALRQSAYDAQLERSQTQYLYAPCAGVVSEITFLKANEEVRAGRQIAVIYDPNVYLFRYDNPNGYLRYNMTVELSYGANSTRTVTQGRVVACDSVKPGVGKGSSVLIAIEIPDADEKLLRPSIEYTYIYVGNVVLVNRSAVTLHGGMYHVYKLSADGMVSKRYANTVQASAASGTWVLHGVDPGEELILN